MNITSTLEAIKNTPEEKMEKLLNEEKNIVESFNVALENFSNVLNIYLDEKAGFLMNLFVEWTIHFFF